MKKIKIISFLLFASVFMPVFLFAQSLTLDQCITKARMNYPLIKQFELIDKTEQLNISNVGKSYLPQVNVNARASYQSDVTSLPISIPNVAIPALSKDQYQASVDVSQLIWDGGVGGAQKRNIRAQADTERQRTEVELYTLTDRVNQMFFAVLLLNEQLKQNEILRNELTINYKRIEAFIDNGLANPTDLDLISVEKLNVSQIEIELVAKRKTYLDMLAAFTAMEIDEKTNFEKPLLPLFDYNMETKRPELLMWNAQMKAAESQKAIISAANLPKLGFFAQGGYGKPALNMLTNEFSGFYVGGLRMSWNLSGFYTKKSNFRKIDISKKTVEVQKETFVFNNNLLSKQQKNELEKLAQVIRNDDEMMQLRTRIKNATQAKLENGTATVTDLLREINAENIVIQAKLLHEMQRLHASYQFKYINNI